MQSKVQKMHFERIVHKESEIPFVRHYPKNWLPSDKWSKAGISNLEIPAPLYTYAREDYLLNDRLNLLPG